MILIGEYCSMWRRTCLGVTLSTTKPTWTDLGLNLGFCGESLVNNCLSHGTATRLQANGFDNHKPWQSVDKVYLPPTQPPVCRLPGTPQPEYEADHSFPSITKVGENMELSLDSATCLHGRVLYLPGNFTCAVYMPFLVSLLRKGWWLNDIVLFPYT